jgi:quinoprotein glucose dehydrogenase
MLRVAPRWLASWLTCFFGAVLFVAADDAPVPMDPVVAPASEDGARALHGFRIPDGLQGSLFAAEPLVANPVSFFVDARGRVFVCESFRQNAGVTDNRGHDEAWLDDDLAAQTVSDRLAYHKKHLRDKIEDYTKQDDRIRLLVDTDKNGQADRATVFANRFNRVVDGTGAGVIEHRGNVYYTCIPDLWQLRDEDGDGAAEVRKSLSDGFGVRVAFRGHDMHGLIVGPDGRLYFSIGDRGYSVSTSDGRLHDPESGAIFRCEMDGSKLEVFATGLRNPQELAFDDHGNLFTGDNNSDSGDKARWVYVVEGGDTGWRMAYQYLPDRGPFNRERIWHPYHAEQPAYIVPPITNFADGPSGLAFYPGTGLPEYFKGRFLLCDFRGGPANSGIRSFRVKPRGAFFEMTDADQPFWNILATDVQFGPDGAIYVSDWVNGWNGEGKGRIYRFVSPADQESQSAREVQYFLSIDLSCMPSERLVELMGHADRRVRQDAQFALADRADVAQLLAATGNSKPPLARLHALWGLSQIARQIPKYQAEIASGTRALLGDQDAEVRAQTAKLLGELSDRSSLAALIGRLNDDDLRVRYFAALALGTFGDTAALPGIFQMLHENADRDPIVRHGGIMALVGMMSAKPAVLDEAIRHSSRSVRLAAVVACRKRKDNSVSRFLKDTDKQVVAEAARAIHDVPLNDAMSDLAELAATDSNDEELLRRILNANFRLGEQQHAEAIAALAAKNDAPVKARIEALDMIASWEKPSPRDRVMGQWRPIATERNNSLAKAALERHLAEYQRGPKEVRAKSALVAQSLRLPTASSSLKAVFADRTQSDGVRAQMVVGLGDLGVADASEVVASALQEDSPRIRAAARQALAKLRPEEGIEQLAKAIAAPSRVERQSALAVLAKVPGDSATAAIESALKRLIAGDIPDDTQLDVIEAASARSIPPLSKLLADYESRRSTDDPLSRFRESLVGGDAAKGERIFFDRTDLSCVRCHKINDRGGEVGPDLTRVATDKQREYLLEAIVAPNRAIAKGFESVVLVDVNGRIHVGILKSEDDNQIRLITADGQSVTVNKADVEERSPGKSPMPEDVVTKISKRDLRDLVEYLSTLK